MSRQMARPMTRPTSQGIKDAEVTSEALTPIPGAFRTRRTAVSGRRRLSLLGLREQIETWVNEGGAGDEA